ncbi:hypothetical protein [Paenibacillus xylanexedens]|uniref:hypothetical protein n=1 Tax=Paenibacillus xylanexedens TaxID=528191 RepID=UPI0011A07E3B|nr:hypothetical protein [Paenibacillus xylanexedens]
MRLSNTVRARLKSIAFYYLGQKLNRRQDEIIMLDEIHKDIKRLGRQWESTLINTTPHVLDLSIKSYFVHGTPMVSYAGIDPGKTQVEFGDVLYVYTETDLKHKVRENAILYQAKKYSSSSVDAHQLKLYLNWPSFWFTKKAMSKKKYNVVTYPNPHPGARYLLLDNSSSNPYFASTMTPTPNLKANLYDGFLFNELVGLLDFTSGRELKGDWGEAIEEVKNDILINKKKFRKTLRNQPLLYLEGRDSTLFSDERDFTNGDSKGFWLVHIKSSVTSLEYRED